MIGCLWRGGGAVVAGALLLAACSNPIVASVQPTPTPLPTPVPPARPTFTVTRGAITDTIQTTGRVVAAQQQDLYFRQPGNLDRINVHLQDHVKKGQVLAYLDTATLQQEIAQQQAAVDEAKLELQKAQATQVNGNAGSDQGIAAADAAVKSAQADEDTAAAKLAALTSPSADDVTQAQADVTVAQAALTTAQLKYQALRNQGAGQNALGQAWQDVVSAQGKLDAAQATLHALLHPSDAVVRQARDAVAKAQAEVAEAQAKAKQAREVATEGNTNDIDLAIYRKKVDEAQLQLDALNGQLAQLQIIAPFDGIVIATNGQPGDKITAYTPVVTVANPASLELAADVPQDELPKVAIGQQANIVMDSFAGKNIPGKVTALPSAALGSSSGSGNGSSGNQGGNASGQSGSGGNQSASAPPTLDTAPRITVQWPGPGAELGQLARVTLTVQTKDNVLKIPTAAVNKINNRTFVMLDESGRQTPVDIKVGIQTDQWTEVLSGLSAGQQVFSRGQ